MRRNLQGRLLYDVFIYPLNRGLNFPHPVFLLDCALPSLPELHTHLRRYLLRSKVQIRNATDQYVLWGIWGPRAHEFWGAPPKEPEDMPRGSMVFKEEKCADVGCRDPRWKGMGLRVLVERKKKRE